MEENLKLILEEIKEMKADIKEIKADLKVVKTQVDSINGFTTNADVLNNLEFLKHQHASSH